MKFLSRVLEVDAFRFDGTRESAQSAQDFVSSLDVENAEVTWQGEAEPIALDLTTEHGLRTLEAGEWLVCRAGKLTAETAEGFEATYERI